LNDIEQRNNGVMAVIMRSFTEFGSFRGALYCYFQIQLQV